MDSMTPMLASQYPLSNDLRYPVLKRHGIPIATSAAAC
jgi:hypothetical protein